MSNSSTSSSSVQPLTESSTVQQVYDQCHSYHALLHHPHRPRLGVLTSLLSCIRTYKSQHRLPTLDAAFKAHRHYVLHPAPPPPRKRQRDDVVTPTAGTAEPSSAPSLSVAERDVGWHQRLDELESKWQQRVDVLETRYQQRIDELEQKVQQIEWQADNRLPHRIHRQFTILTELGIGPRAAVYKCINRSTNMHVALKVAQDPSEPNVVRQDALVMQRIRWPYMIRVYGSSESVHDASKMEEVDAVEMRLFQDSLSLDLQAHDRGRRPQRTPLFCLQHMHGMLNKLAAWHAKGVVHCDIKPDNVMWSDDEQRYVLIDFGHSLIVADEHLVAKRGTTEYTAPEVLGCHFRSAPSNGPRWVTKGDMWSLGVMLMYVCSKKPRRVPFGASNAAGSEERKTLVSNAIVQYIRRSTDERKQWLSQQLSIDEPTMMSSMVDLLCGVLCEPEHRWDMDRVRRHQLWSAVNSV